jgi:NAD(P)-dependent dehydrogenase (short-subunit alcohol dehydrogenase family)
VRRLEETTDMKLTLDGRTALITGANGGLGAHFARTLASAGAKVAIAARRLETLRDLERQIQAAGGQAQPVALDVSQRDSVVRAFDRAAEALGPVTVVVNNAGIAVTKPLLDHTEDDWNEVIGVNLTGAWRVAQEAARHMVANQKGGSIVNIASVLGLRVSAQVPSYVASKAAVIHLTKAMALELARHKIRVNALAPGYVETSINREFFDSDAGQALIKRIPQRRIGNPEELDAALLLFASDAGSYTTGAVLAVDGGHLVSTL